MRVARCNRRRQREAGLVTVIVLALVILLGIYLEINMRVLAHLKGEVQLIDQSKTVSEPVDAKPEP